MYIYMNTINVIKNSKISLKILYIVIIIALLQLPVNIYLYAGIYNYYNHLILSLYSISIIFTIVSPFIFNYNVFIGLIILYLNLKSINKHIELTSNENSLVWLFTQIIRAINCIFKPNFFKCLKSL